MTSPKRIEFDRYFLMLIDPGNMEKTCKEFAEELGVGESTIWNWNRKLDWADINERRRASYGRIISTVDSALLKKAQKGDTEAIKLFYARFDGYIPVSGTVDLSDKKDDELRKRADEIKAELLSKSNGSGIGQDLPRAGEARA